MHLQIRLLQSSTCASPSLTTAPFTLDNFMCLLKHVEMLSCPCDNVGKCLQSQGVGNFNIKTARLVHQRQLY